MKRLTLLVMPLLTLSLLASCNKGGGGSGGNLYQVTEEEFNNALSFKDIEYLQVDNVSKIVQRGYHEFSPTVYHKIDYYYYSEYYYQKDNPVGYHRSSDSIPFSEIEAKPSDFKTPTEKFNLLEKFRKEFEIENIYAEFEFKNNYYIAKKIYDFKLQFKDKRIISYDCSSLDRVNITFTYNETTPTFPPSPLTSKV